jgi:hypothetical protein
LFRKVFFFFCWLRLATFRVQMSSSTSIYYIKNTNICEYKILRCKWISETIVYPLNYKTIQYSVRSHEKCARDWQKKLSNDVSIICHKNLPSLDLYLETLSNDINLCQIILIYFDYFLVNGKSRNAHAPYI